ncbi:beta-lactamase class C [Dyadobacter koreensis]|uniref:Beta-lactamase n=1 Tax=Dyadobacter koreensis TaxID=408657 RepID=A0A1H6Z1T6_9BACT|nr:class C beta-lactamase [Dyadobacter koreensis]SEJ43500.1 beta-lactamase class C [Dyadobacter koreensis]
MIRNYFTAFLLIPFFTFGQPQKTPVTSNATPAKIQLEIDNLIRPAMQEFNIPGIAVAVTINGEHYFYNYGVASKETGQPVTNETIFEIGSISKTFTATMASYAQVSGKLSFSENISKYLPALRGSAFDKITVLNAATHTTGGLPLQFPDEIMDNRQATKYFKTWKPKFEAGTHRSYSNPGTGLLGMAAAASLDDPFEKIMEKTIFPALGMSHSYINVPKAQLKKYAYGYSKTDEAVRVNPGPLASEAYGVKSTSEDMIRYVDANLQILKLDKKIETAIQNTHVAYFKIGEMTQDLIWEQYPYPVEVKQLLAGNSNTIIFEHNPAEKIDSPKPDLNVLINKTGSTNGFGGYVAFVPARKIGIVILANKNYPITARVTIAQQILNQLDRYAPLKTSK